MQRRSLLKLGAASAAALAVTGGILTLLGSTADSTKLSSTARQLFQAVGRAVLDGSLPDETAARGQALTGLPDRVDGVIAQLPPHAQAELTQLVTVLTSAVGRATLAGLPTPWSEASTADIQQSLQAMRMSRWTLRRQAYQALHDIVGGAYFSDPLAWPALGYPGPGITFS